MKCTYIVQNNGYCLKLKRSKQEESQLAVFISVFIICPKYRVGIKGSWFVNHESISWSHKPKIC